MKIYAVVFSNYEPAEVDSLWERREDAEKRVAELLSKRDAWGWEVAEWEVHPPAEDEPVSA